MDYNNLVLNKNINYYHNPFGGIHDDDLLDIIDPKHSLEELVDLLHQDGPIIIQFVGRKGRGKTTHLRALYQLSTNSQIHLLDRYGFTHIATPNNSNIFIDSVHHIPWRKRLLLWKQQNTTYIITTHWFRNIELYLCNRKYKTFRFKGITAVELEDIIKKRISQFSSIDYDQIRINTKMIHVLIKKFGDNIRGILNFLYDHFQTKLYGY